MFMRFQTKLFLSVFCLVLLGMLLMLGQEPANAQLPQCTCDNSFDSVCADGFLVTFEGRTNNTFTYSICNEGKNVPPCNFSKALSHADIIISNDSCIQNPASNISTTLIAVNGGETACDPPKSGDPSCDGADPVSGQLIKCAVGDSLSPGEGECIEIEIEIENASGIMVGPTIALNKAAMVCGSGCLMGPSCLGCGDPPLNPCMVTVEKELNNSDGPATFGYFADFNGGSTDFNFSLTAPNPTPSLSFNLLEGEVVTVTENVFPQDWTFADVVCVEGGNITCDDLGNPSFMCECTTGGNGLATCTFTNDPPVQPPCNIEIVKETNPREDPQAFNFISNKTPNTFQLQDGDTQPINSIDVGVLTAVEESLPENWVLDNIVCEGGSQNQFDRVLEDQLVRITCDTSEQGVTRTCTYKNRFDPPPPSSIPTNSQWGLIIMAGLLGIFSLLIIMRRQRYNVS